MTAIIIDTFLEAVSSNKLMLNKSVSLYSAQKEIMAIGAESKLNKLIVEAALISFGLIPKYNAKVELDLLQRITSPEIVRIAVLFASQPDVWSTMNATPAMIDALRTIDTLHAMGKNTLGDSQDKFRIAKKLNTNAAARANNLTDLNTKRNLFLSNSCLRTKTGIGINARDSAIFLYLAKIALSPDDSMIFELNTVGKNAETISHRINNKMARELVNEFNELFDKHNVEIEAQLANIKQGTYDTSFNFK